MRLKINISEFSDFCFGVKRAISLAERALNNKKGSVYSLGALIHNQRVVDGLSGKGLKIALDHKKLKKGTVVTRSHGVDPATLLELGRKRIDIIDATCPFVKNAQMIAAKLREEGYKIIIVGDKGHPEVRSLRVFSGEGALTLADRSDAKRLNVKKGKIGVISQTTQSRKNFLEVISALLERDFDEVRVFNTICSDVSMRQRSTERFSRDNDLVLVVGGKNSANTRRLHEICKSMGTRSYHIEGKDDIKKVWFKGKSRIGIVSGASTPRWIVDEVVDRLRRVQ